MTRPARIVSGDLYDFFSFSNNEVGLLCADVSGKGMSAALMMAHLQAVAHGRMLTLDQPSARRSPSAFAAMLNRDLCGRFGDNRYATTFYGEYDSGSRLLRYMNAGHCRPIFISEAGEVTALPNGDLPCHLGVWQRFGTKWAIWRRFEQRNIQVNRDRLAQALLEQFRGE